MPLNAQQTIKAAAPTLRLPPGGWTAATFRVHGAALMAAQARVAFLAQRRAIPVLANISRKLFVRQLREVIKWATENSQRRGRSAKLAVDLEFPQHEGLWREAIDHVFREANLDLVTELMPPIQSVMAQGYSRTSILLGLDSRDVNAAIARDAREIAKRVVQINETTRNNIVSVVKESIGNNLTVSETASALETKVPQIFGNRALTVARTELNNAFNQGAANSFKQSSTLTHISVIGCEAREPNSPQYHNQSTCNYPDLPIIELDAFLEVGFHPNHTGNLVPSGFRDAG